MCVMRVAADGVGVVNLRGNDTVVADAMIAEWVSILAKRSLI
jgi:hypothetical protein